MIYKLTDSNVEAAMQWFSKLLLVVTNDFTFSNKKEIQLKLIFLLVGLTLFLVRKF